MKFAFMVTLWIRSIANVFFIKDVLKININAVVIRIFRWRTILTMYSVIINVKVPNGDYLKNISTLMMKSEYYTPTMPISNCYSIQTTQKTNLQLKLKLWLDFFCFVFFALIWNQKLETTSPSGQYFFKPYIFLPIVK